MSDRIAVMRSGRLEQVGAPEALYERPATEFVAGFLGVSNFLDGEVVGRTGDLVDVQLVDGTLVRAPGASVNGSRRVRVGVRPEKLRLRHDAPDEDAASNTVRGKVLDASYLGVSTQYLVETSDGHRMTVYAQNLETSGSSEMIGDGEPVRLTWQPRHTFVIETHGGSDGEVAQLEEESDT